jgi:Zn-dependent protease with chaperone function
MKAILKGIDYQPSDERTSNIVHEVSNKLRIKPPKVFTTDNIKIIALSAKMNPKENFILISRKVVQQLDSDELKAIIAHECHHIRTDVEEVTRTALGFSRYLAEYPLLFTFVLVICTISYYFFGLFSEEGYFPFFITDLLALSAFYLTLYLVVIFFNPNALFGSLYPHLRELDADLISSFVTRKPRALVSALRTIILMKIVDVRFSSLQFYKPINKEIRIKRWRELFFTEPRITWGITHPSPLRRIKFLKLLHELMNKEVSIKLNKPLTRFLALRIYFPNFVLLWSPWGRRLRRIGEEKIKAVYNYMESNSNNFNLAKCAENLKMDELDVATIFFSFLMRDIVNVIDPAP